MNFCIIFVTSVWFRFCEPLPRTTFKTRWIPRGGIVFRYFLYLRKFVFFFSFFCFSYTPLRSVRNEMRTFLFYSRSIVPCELSPPRLWHPRRCLNIIYIVIGTKCQKKKQKKRYRRGWQSNSNNGRVENHCRDGFSSRQMVHYHFYYALIIAWISKKKNYNYTLYAHINQKQSEFRLNARGVRVFVDFTLPP